MHRAAVFSGAALLAVAAGVAYFGYVEARAVGRARFDIVAGAFSLGACLASASMLLWALWGSPPRGRKRCPRCWYEMDGCVPGGKLICPECGHDAVQVRNLLRRRRRTGLALAVAPLVPLSLALPWAVIGVRRGPLAAVPGPVLVLGMWRLPDSWICPPEAAFNASEHLAIRLYRQDLMSPTVRSWAFSRIREELRTRSSPASFKRAAMLSAYDPDQAGLAPILAEAILDLADSLDLDHRAVRVGFSPRLGGAPGQNSSALREVLTRRLPELKRLMEREDAEANTFAYLAIPLGREAAPLVPCLEAGARSQGVGLGWVSALQVLNMLVDACPEAQAALLRALDSPDVTLVEHALLTGFSADVQAEPIRRRIRTLADSGDVRVAVTAYRRLAARWDSAGAVPGEIRGLASSPGPRREIGLRAYAATAPWNEEIAEVLGAAEKDPDPRVRLAIVELARERWAAGEGFRRLLHALTADQDPAVAQAATAAESSLPK